MSDKIFKDYPSSGRQGTKTVSGTHETTRAKPLPYSTPVGPKGQDHKGPGLGGTNHGNCGTQYKR